MTQITTHILDTSIGRPAADVPITLLQQSGDDWLVLGSARTDADGRVTSFVESTDPFSAGVYKLTFFIGDYYVAQKRDSFYPYVDVVFEIAGDGQHYHVPLLLNPFGYTTYRGS